MPPEQNCPPVKVRVWVGQFLPKENYPLVRVGVWVKVRVSFRVGEKTANCPRRKLPSARVRVWARVSFRLGVNFPRGKLTLSANPYCPIEPYCLFEHREPYCP